MLAASNSDLFRRFSKTGVILGLVLSLATTAPCLAQRKKLDAGKQPQFPFFDGKTFFDQFFGPGDDAQREELAKVEVSVREESEYGEQVLQTFFEDFKRQKIDLATRGRDVDYLKKLVETLRPQMKNHQRYRSIRVFLADSSVTDAYSIPGGTLIIFRGMMELAGSEAALVGVIGHELSHLDRGHQLLPVRRMKLARQNVNAIRHDPSAMFKQVNLMMSAFMRPFRPEDETEADLDGATWAYRAGYDPEAMAALFLRLSERDQVGRFAPAFLRTHPYHADRHAAVEQLVRELQVSEPRDNLYVGKPNLQKRVPASERKFDE